MFPLLFDRDLAYAESKLPTIGATDPNLMEFKKRNGQLLMYHGWADPVVPPEDGIRYYESVERAMAGEANTAAFFRLFMAPGMGHCGGGDGPDTSDALNALDQWVAEGKAPEKIIASHAINGIVDRTRPLCPYPREPKWTGAGNTEDAGAFVCAR